MSRLVSVRCSRRNTRWWECSGSTCNLWGATTAGTGNASFFCHCASVLSCRSTWADELAFLYLVQRSISLQSTSGWRTIRVGWSFFAGLLDWKYQISFTGEGRTVFAPSLCGFRPVMWGGLFPSHFITSWLCPALMSPPLMLKAGSCRSGGSHRKWQKEECKNVHGLLS